MNAKEPVEKTGASIDEAVGEALKELGANEDDVVIEVLSTPRSGLLGLGSRTARVRVKLRTEEGAHSGVQSPPSAQEKARAQSSEPARPRENAGNDQEPEDGAADERQPADLQDQAREAGEILSQILSLMGEKAEVRFAGSDAEAIELEIKGDGSGILIGRHGQTLDALEYMLNRLVARRIRDAVAVVIDTESYRARRRSQLERMALSMGERAKREHAKMVMEPMPPRDRRVVHLALKDDPMLTTRSTGDGYVRTVEIVPVEGRQERPSGGGGGTRSRPREREPRETEAPIGQQGGFKRGQKRIV